MCLGVPAQVIEVGAGMAICRSLNGDEPINMMMTGDQPVGTWVLTHLGWAREVISAEDAEQINRALQGLNALMNGNEDIDIDHHFAPTSAGTN